MVDRSGAHDQGKALKVDPSGGVVLHASIQKGTCKSQSCKGVVAD